MSGIGGGSGLTERGREVAGFLFDVGFEFGKARLSTWARVDTLDMQRQESRGLSAYDDHL